MKYSFPRKYRLSNRNDFTSIRRNGRVSNCGPLFTIALRMANEADGSLQIGISVPKRYGNAVLRNRFKRIVREVIRRDNEIKLMPWRLIIGPSLRRNTSSAAPTIGSISEGIKILKSLLKS